MITSPNQANALVIDDFQSMRSMMMGFLKSMGLTKMDNAGTAREALDLLASRKYDLVICDYNLGHGQNGQQILEEAKHKKYIGYSTIWIMVTAEKTMDMFMGAAETKPDDYLLKPITEALLDARLRKLMEKKHSLEPIEKAVRARDYVHAIALCSDMLKTPSPNTLELQRIKSDLLMSTGDFAAAKEFFESILAARNIAWAKTGLGKVYFMTRDFIRAREKFEEVLHENKMYLEAADWLAKTLDAQGDAQAAQQVLDQAMKISPNAVARQQSLADVAYKNGDFDQAKSAYEKAIKLGEFSIHKNADTYVGLARSLVSQNDPDAALKVLDRSRNEFKDDAASAVQIAVAESMAYRGMGATGKANAALALAEDLLQQPGVEAGTQTSIEMASLLLQSGQKEKACRLLEGVVKNHHENAAILQQVGAAFEKAGLAEEGRELISRSAQEVIDINNQGVALANAGKFDDGIALIRKALQAMPNNDLMMTNLCGMMLGKANQSGKDEEAAAEIRELLDRVGRINPTNKKYNLYVNLVAQMFPAASAA